MIRKVQNIKRKLFVLFGLVFSLFCFGQDYTIDVQEFGVEDGLLHRNVLSVFEDNQGFMWIGTSKGVQRFDGHEFRSWTKQHPSEKIFEITTIGQDNAGWLWLWNNDLYEFVFLNPVTEEVLTQKEKFGDDFPITRDSDSKGWNNFSATLFNDSRGRLCFVTSNPSHLLFYDAQEGFEKINLSELGINFFDLKLIDKDDHLWVEEGKDKDVTLHEISNKGEIIQSLRFGTSRSLSCFSEHDGLIHLEQTDKTGVKFVAIDDGDSSVVFSKPYKDEALTFLANGFFWNLDVTGWEVFDGVQGEQVLEIKREDYSKRFFERLTSYLEDSRGGLWFAGRWGLVRIKIHQNLFQKYFYSDELIDIPLNNSSRGIIVDSSHIYASFEFGALVEINKKDPSDWTIVNKNEDLVPYYGRPLLEAENGDFLIGHPAHLRQIDPTTFESKNIRFSEKNDSLVFHIWSIFAEEDMLWMGLDEGLAYSSLKEDKISPLTYLRLDKNGNSVKLEVFQISKFNERFLWLCTTHGLLLFDKEKMAIVRNSDIVSSLESILPATTMFYLYIDKEGIYWIGSDEGLIRWDVAKQEKKIFTTIDGLSNNVIYAIFEDDFNHLWLSSDFGVIQFDKENFQVKSYLPKDGISHFEFNKTAYFQEPDGTIYFGGLNGITAFDPADFYKQELNQPFKMVLTGYEIFDGDTGGVLDQSGEIKQTNSITFDPNDRFFRLNFSLLTMEDAERVSYAWRIEGIDDEWNFQKTNSIQFGKLPYGSHKLIIKGQNSGGQWSPHLLKIDLHILRPFYLTYVFFVFVGLAVFIGVWAYNRYRILQFNRRQKILEEKIEDATIQIRNDKLIIEKQTDELRQLDEVKSRFFANVSHELRTPLTLIMGPISSILKNAQLEIKERKLLGVAKRSSEDLLKLIGSILDLSKMEAGKIELDNQVENLYSILLHLFTAFESHADRNGIQFLFQYEAKRNLQLVIDKDKLEVIINNLLSNAIKFTPRSGKITVNVSSIENEIKIKVRDTGKGIHPDDLPLVFERFYQSRKSDISTEGGTGIGLALSREFARLMDGDIIATSEWGKGSVFSFSFPKKEVSIRAIDNKELTGNRVVEEQAYEVSQTSEKSMVSTPKGRILIVEDNDSLREYLKDILETEFEIVSVENGKKALLSLQENKFQLILSDIMMPVMDGYELLERLKSNNQYSHIPVVMLTARADIQDKLRALRIGVDDYLLKPFNEEELKARINNLLDNARSRRAPVDEVEPKSTSPEFSQEDRMWLEVCEKLLSNKLGDPNYTIAKLSYDLAVSESTLARQLKRLTGMTPSRYFQEMRLNESRGLLESRVFNTIAQVAYQVGFSDTKAFSRSYKKRYGRLPSEVIK